VTGNLFWNTPPRIDLCAGTRFRVRPHNLMLEATPVLLRVLPNDRSRCRRLGLRSRSAEKVSRQLAGLRNSARKGKKALKLQRPFPSSQSQSRGPNIERCSGFFFTAAATGICDWAFPKEKEDESIFGASHNGAYRNGKLHYFGHSASGFM
jgi:hypothetical protein